MYRLLQAIAAVPLSVGMFLCWPLGAACAGGGSKAWVYYLFGIPFIIGWPFLWTGSALMEFVEKKTGANYNFFR